MNKTNKILIGSVSALCIVGTLTLLKAVFNDGGKMVTDWISALSNALMAGAAIFAALQAKRWFSNLSYATAFNKAAEFLSKIDAEIDEINGCLDKTDELHENITAVHKGIIRFDISVYQSNDNLVSYYYSKSQSIIKLKQEYEQLKRWPIERCQVKSIYEILKNINVFYALMVSTYDIGNNVLISIHNNEDNNTTIYYDEYMKALKKTREQSHVLDSLYREFNNNAFSDYFTAK